MGGAPKSLEARGSQVILAFDKYVPEITGKQVRDLLAPVFDFKALPKPKPTKRRCLRKSRMQSRTTRYWWAWIATW